MITVETELGTIKVARSVIGNIIIDVVDSFDGKVMISNSRGRLPNQLAYKIGPREESSEIGIELTEEGMNLRLYVVLKFGTSIKETTGKIISEVRRLMLETVGMEINDFTVVVTGVMSKNIAPRHIEVKG